MRGAAIVVFAAAMTAVLYFALYRGEDGPPGFDTVRPRVARDYQGVVRRDGQPVAGATVTLYESGTEAAAGPDARATTTADGAFRVSWQPQTTVDARRVFLHARVGDLEAIAPARRGTTGKGGTILDLAAPATATVEVVDASGQSIPGVRVVAALRDGRLLGPLAAGKDPATHSLTAPRGMRLDLVVTAPGHASRVDRRFTGGEAVRIHLPPGRPANVRVRDPDGLPVADALVRFGGPRGLAVHLPFVRTGADGTATLANVSDGEGAYLTVQKEGFLRAGVPVWPGTEREVVLWPRRDVSVLAWDSASRQGIDGARLKAQIDPVNSAGAWHVGHHGALVRDTPVRPGDGAGLYVVGVPRTPCLLFIETDDYPEETVELGIDRKRVRVRLTAPGSRSRPGRIELQADGHKGELPLAIADEGGGFHRMVWLRDGKAAVDVAPNVKLVVASVRAADGWWLPVFPVGKVRERKTRRLKITLEKAVRMTVVTDPPSAGTVEVHDLIYDRREARVESELADGRAVFWVRPRRRVRITVKPRDNFAPEKSWIKTPRAVFEHVVRLSRQAGARWHVIDAAGKPIPFASIHVWEPGLDGQLELRVAPRVVLADAAGHASLLGLRSGRATGEVRAPGFRTARLGLFGLEAGEVPPARRVELVAAGYWAGTVRDEAKKPLGGAGARILWPRVKPLETPGGGQRLVYELARMGKAHVRTGPDGALLVRDESPARVAPLLVIDAGRPGDYAPGFSVLSATEEPRRVPFDLPRIAYVEVDVSGRIDGVYVMLPGGRGAVLVTVDRAVTLRPMPVRLPAGGHSLYLRMADGRWDALHVELAAGQTQRWTPRLRR